MVRFYQTLPRYYFCKLCPSINYATGERRAINLEHPHARTVLSWIRQVVSARGDGGTHLVVQKCVAAIAIGRTIKMLSDWHGKFVMSGSSVAMSPTTQHQQHVPIARFLSAPHLGPAVQTLINLLLKVAKETDPPLRVCMLYQIGVAMRSLGWSFYPFLKDTLRLSAAHLLADTRENPVIAAALGDILCTTVEAVLAEDAGGAPPAGGGICSRTGLASPLSLNNIFGNVLDRDLAHRLSIIFGDLKRQPPPLGRDPIEQAILLRCSDRMLAALRTEKGLRVESSPATSPQDAGVKKSLPFSSQLQQLVLTRNSLSAGAAQNVGLLHAACQNLLAGLYEADLGVHMLLTGKNGKSGAATFLSLCQHAAEVQAAALPIAQQRIGFMMEVLAPHTQATRQMALQILSCVECPAVLLSGRSAAEQERFVMELFYLFDRDPECSDMWSGY